MAKEFVVGHGDLHTMLCNEKILDPLIEGFNMVSRFSGYVGRAQARGIAPSFICGSELSIFQKSFSSAIQNAALLWAAEPDYISSGSRQSSSLHSMCSRSQIGRSLEEICSVL